MLFWRNKMRSRKAHLEEAIASIDKKFLQKRCSLMSRPTWRSLLMIKLIDTSTAVGKCDYAFDAAAVEPRFNGQCS
ncbi:hypothetical protein SD81_017140 [Tolypothrix campylonemoides VB511288]|nr:hypothetical protein SD81_017140 [Tolypothrix campylonemoides VB511288]